MEHHEVCSHLIVFIKANLLADDIDLQPEDSLTALGLDSFSLIEILLFVERKYETIVPIEDLNREKTETAAAIASEVVTYYNQQHG